MVDISQDYNVVEKCAMTAHFRAAVHANLKDAYRKKETRQEKELSMRSMINSEERVLRIIAAVKEYENPFAFSSTRKSKLKNIVAGSVVGSDHLKDILIGKEHLDRLINEQFFEQFWDSIKKLNSKTFSSGDKPIVCKKKKQTKQSLWRQT